MAAAKKKPKAKVKPKAKKAPAKKPAVRKKSTAPKKKPAARKPAARAAAPKPAAQAAPKPRPAPAAPAPAAAPARPAPLPGEEPIGVVTHYYGHLSVAVVRLDAGTLSVGDTIRILGHTSDFRQKVESLQIEHESVPEVGRRQEFGLKVKEHVREHDVVYKVTA
jgi:putative protease